MTSIDAQLLLTLARLSLIHPAWRFGQMICNLAALTNDRQNGVQAMPSGILLAAAKMHVVGIDGEKEFSGMCGSPPAEFIEIRFAILECMAELCESSGNQKFGEIVFSVASKAMGGLNPSVAWDCEDKPFLNACLVMIAKKDELEKTGSAI